MLGALPFSISLVASSSVGFGDGVFSARSSSSSDVPQSLDQTDQNVPDVPTEVHPTNQIRQIDRAVYRLDPRTSGLELRPDPRPDARTDRTEARLTRQAKTDSQARLDLDHARLEKDHARLEKDHARLEKDHARIDLDHEVSQNDRDFSLLARLAHTAHIESSDFGTANRRYADTHIPLFSYVLIRHLAEGPNGRTSPMPLTH
ncbi:hypothetical protein DY000_02054175 [Brassica cretica]|uniref:GAGA-binding transcriptional activator n=1 Tax=Brassica cretica TaxID=69181 RepID=A0ABQ7AA17_BRACR|nr:hypothetical protein DY000_02054175 [Brassica cretica]